MNDKVNILHDPLEEDVLRDSILPLLAEREVNIQVHRVDQLPEWGEGEVVITYLNDDALAQVLPVAAERGWKLGLLPHPQMSHARIGFGIAADLGDAMDDILTHEKCHRVDILYCNDRPVFQSVRIGDVFSLRPGLGREPLRERLRMLWQRLRAVGSLVPKPFTLTSGKEKTIETAALGVVVVEHARNSLVARRLVPDTNINDGMLHTLVLSPRSLFEMLGFLLKSMLFPARRMTKLPEFVGHIKTSALAISSNKPLDYYHDGVQLSATDLRLQVAPASLILIPGRYLEIDEGVAEVKENFRPRGLPTGEARRELISRPLPWLTHAGTEDFRDLYLVLRDNAQASQSYMTLMVLSTLLAAIGLYANSAPVIIGAMILAPLMSPIVSVSMAVVRQDESLLTTGMRTLGVGVLLALGFAATASAIVPLTAITPEIQARLTPTLLDLGVAVISGIAAAYAHAREEVVKSLAGVAIAVALVPPLAVSGIGIGWWDFAVFSGAFLLFLTNLAGIILAAGITFLLLGFAPFHLAQRGLLITLAAVLAVSIPLTLSFTSMAREHAIIRALEGVTIEDALVRNVRVSPGEPLRLSVRLLTPSALGDEQLDRIKEDIENRLGRSITLEAVSAVVR